MSTTNRIEELEEMKQEFILNDAVTEDDHPSWGEIAEAQDKAESLWDETDEGKELKTLTRKVMDKCKFRSHVYDILQKVKTGEMSISQAQKRIVRAAKRTTFDDSESEHQED